jgi:cyclophilin family peptidyl-prolyl cis-trans isomerase
MKPLHLGLALVLTVTALSSCKRDAQAPDDRTSSSQAIDTAQLAPPASPRPVDTAATVDTVAGPPVVTATATIVTGMGNIEVELYGKDAPKTVKNFVELAKKKYYDGLAFHRVVPNYVIQGGDPNTRDTTKRDLWGSGGESIYGGAFEDELNPNSPSGRRGYVEGVLAMANAGPNTNGSQFFIVLSTAGASHLTYNYTIFGKVTKGMDVAHKIEQTGNTGELPQHPVIIKTITVKENAAASAGAASAQQ